MTITQFRGGKMTTDKNILLKSEIHLIRLGKELIDLYHADLNHEIMLPATDLRMAVYAMQIALESSLPTGTDSFLYPSLRMAIDEYERDQRNIRILAWQLAEFTNQVSRHLGFLEESVKNGVPENENDLSKVLDHLVGPKLIFSRLRAARGLSAA